MPIVQKKSGMEQEKFGTESQNAGRLFRHSRGNMPGVIVTGLQEEIIPSIKCLGIVKNQKTKKLNI